MSDDELSEQSLEEKSRVNVPISTDRSLCLRVQKVVNADGTNKLTTWHCENCNATFLRKRDERKHAYRTNVWLRKKAADPEQVSHQAKGSNKRKATEIDTEVESALEAEGGNERKRVQRGRRGGVMHPKLGPCRDWAKGKCTKGVRCKFTHVNTEHHGGAEGSGGGDSSHRPRVEEGGSNSRLGVHGNGGGLEGHEEVTLQSKKHDKKRASIVSDRVHGDSGPLTVVDKGGRIGKAKTRKVKSASLSLGSEEQSHVNRKSGALENPLGGENTSPTHTQNGKRIKSKKPKLNSKVVDEKPLILT